MNFFPTASALNTPWNTITDLSCRLEQVFNPLKQGLKEKGFLKCVSSGWWDPKLVLSVQPAFTPGRMPGWQDSGANCSCLQYMDKEVKVVLTGAVEQFKRTQEKGEVAEALQTRMRFLSVFKQLEVAESNFADAGRIASAEALRGRRQEIQRLLKIPFSDETQFLKELPQLLKEAVSNDVLRAKAICQELKAHCKDTLDFLSRARPIVIAHFDALDSAIEPLPLAYLAFEILTIDDILNWGRHWSNGIDDIREEFNLKEACVYYWLGLGMCSARRVKIQECFAQEKSNGLPLWQGLWRVSLGFKELDRSHPFWTPVRNGIQAFHEMYLQRVRQLYEVDPAYRKTVDVELSYFPWSEDSNTVSLLERHFKSIQESIRTAAGTLPQHQPKAFIEDMIETCRLAVTLWEVLVQFAARKGALTDSQTPVRVSAVRELQQPDTMTLLRSEQQRTCSAISAITDSFLASQLAPQLTQLQALQSRRLLTCRELIDSLTRLQQEKSCSVDTIDALLTEYATWKNELNSHVELCTAFKNFIICHVVDRSYTGLVEHLCPQLSADDLYTVGITTSQGKYKTNEGYLRFLAWLSRNPTRADALYQRIAALQLDQMDELLLWQGLCENLKALKFTSTLSPDLRTVIDQFCKACSTTFQKLMK